MTNGPLSRHRVIRPVRLGLKDPAYISATALELLIAQMNGIKYRQLISAEELEASFMRVPTDPAEHADYHPLAAELEGKPEDRVYNNAARLVARWILEHCDKNPEDRGLASTLRLELAKTHQAKWHQLRVTSVQWGWAMAAAHRVMDAHDLG